MDTGRIVEPGVNCWRVEQADRVACLIDGERYFSAFRAAACNAERSILIIGWDIDSRFELVRERNVDGLPSRLGEFLLALIRRRKSLKIHALDWDYIKLYAPERDWFSFAKLGWRSHRLRYRMDNQYPFGACHHQKIVVVDDKLAFAGGLDFALGRWDTSEHMPGDPRRANGEEIDRPYHDIQVLVSGPCAAALGELARQRWRWATGRRLRAPVLPSGHDPWPSSVEPDFTDVRLGIARTLPSYRGREQVREVERLWIDAIAAARRMIYIENQYLTAESIGDALARKLAEKHGPEVVIVLPRKTSGWLSRMTMDVMRERLMRRLEESDSHDRLRVYYPRNEGSDAQCVNVHAKLLVIDDVLLRIGSSNLNHRSMGLDTECDLVLEARGDADVARRIGELRNRFVAEHLHQPPERIAEEVARTGSLTRAIDALRGGERTLEPLGYYVTDDVDALVPSARVADPEEPLEPEYFAKQLVDEDANPARSALLTLALLLGLALALAAAWRWTPLGEAIDTGAIVQWFGALRADWRAFPLVVLAFVAAGLVVFPVTLLILGAGVVFGIWPGSVYAMCGAVASATVSFALGRLLGGRKLRRLPGHWIARISRRLARQGLLAVITLRIVPVAPFTVVNLMAGASHIGWRSFTLGTAIGMAPATLALTAFSDRLFAAITVPGVTRVAALVAIAVVIGAGAWWLRAWIDKRLRRRRHHDNGPSPDDRAQRQPE